MNIEIDWVDKSFSNDRKKFRSEVIEGFLEEDAGTGKGNLATKYRYIVARFGANTIYLQRPAQFNNGFDFTLNVSGINFNPNGRATTRPTHDNILTDLKQKKIENSLLYQQLKTEIDLIFNCQHNNKNWNRIQFSSGLNVPILLTCIKWLFLEQDVTYWNYSGRNMLFNAIEQI